MAQLFQHLHEKIPMAKGGPFIILEDDPDDREILEQAFKKLGVTNTLRFFEDGKDVLQYLRVTREQPFIILSNIRLIGMNGFELRQKIQEDDYLRKKGIPFVFLSIDARKEVVEQAYELTVQGFFEKQNTLEEVEWELRMIIGYWEQCKHPNLPYL